MLLGEQTVAIQETALFPQSLLRGILASEASSGRVDACYNRRKQMWRRCWQRLPQPDVMVPDHMLVDTPPLDSSSIPAYIHCKRLQSYPGEKS